jgi:small subunit ribosomal protein S20
MGKASSLSTKKRLRQTKRAQAVNKANKTRVKTQLKKARAVEGSDLQKILPETYSVIDRAVRKGVMHKNAAARLKSRLSKQA